MTVLTEPVCIVDGAHGVYVPMVWAERYGSQAVKSAGVSAENVTILLFGPDNDLRGWNEIYWEAWESVLNSYSHEVDGVKHHLIQDGDLFEFPESYSWEES